MKRVKAISTKGSTKDSKNKFGILNGAENFSSGIFQNYLEFKRAKKYTNFFSGTTWIDLWQ